MKVAALCSQHSPTLRSEEHTSELQSRSDLVCRLLLEKKNRTAGGLALATLVACVLAPTRALPAERSASGKSVASNPAPTTASKKADSGKADSGKPWQVEATVKPAISRKKEQPENGPTRYPDGNYLVGP